MDGDVSGDLDRLRQNPHDPVEHLLLLRCRQYEMSRDGRELADIVGSIAESVATGEGAKSVAVNPCTGRVLVANRLTGSLSGVDPRAGTAVESVTTDVYPNHVRVTDDSTAYVVDKSGSGPSGEDGITRIRFSPQGSHAAPRLLIWSRRTTTRAAYRW
ncbi:YncE family protein [Streptomyces sp. NPDC051064]|uniref:YncE family protein n=1 Tax=Streptomyces sp. NPDC051064 TaxID=3365641 RepID=UPI00378F2D85